MVGAALVSGAGVAAASPADDAYLAQLRAAGLTWAPEHDGAMIGMGWLICDDLGWGWTPEQIARDVHANLDSRGAAVGDIANMVGIAHRVYCPNQICWAPHC
jgi:hypothetical protein